MDRLALHGGDPIRTTPFPSRPSFGDAERRAVGRVLDEGVLSGFLAAREGFLGGPRVRELEDAFAEALGVVYAVTMNSATSCLFAAVRAVGVRPGDEVLVTPWSMSASATCILAAGATPVFADVEDGTYGIASGPLGSKTRAIILTHLFGCPARSLIALRNYARGHGIALIEDAAQAIGATWHGAGQDGPRPVGTFGDVGVFSLNYHKTIQCGEGGIAVTDSKRIADRLRLLRNHGETVAEDYWTDSAFAFENVGGNYRMGEIEAAIARVQLDRLEELTVPRIENAEMITAQIADLEGLDTPTVPSGLRHVYYLYALRVRPPVSADAFAAALRAEGVPVDRYVAPLYRLPAFEPATWGTGRELTHPIVEACWREVLVLPHVHAGMGRRDVEELILAIRKVHRHRNEL